MAMEARVLQCERITNSAKRWRSVGEVFLPGGAVAETHEITVVPQPQAEFDDSHFVRVDVCDIFLSHFLVNLFIMRNTSQIAADFLH